MTGYLDLDGELQAEALRPVAVEAAARFGLGVGRLDVHTHSYNTTYSLLTPGGERFALRLGTYSTSDLKWPQGHLAVFDFDDCGLGVPALDLAISAFYLGSGDASAEKALLSGYASVSPLPHVRTEVFEGLVASRQLLLANDLLGSTTAQWRGQGDDYLRVSVDRLRAWLETGRFSHVVPAS